MWWKMERLLKKIHKKKALEISKFIKITTISDDSGLCVDALNGEPGIFSARYAGEDGNDEKNNEKLLQNLKDVPKEKRTAHFISVVSIAFPDGKVESFSGRADGEILFENCGDGGFGYDPLFYSYDLKKSFGVASPEEKKSVSHRGRAFRKLIESRILESKNNVSKFENK